MIRSLGEMLQPVRLLMPALIPAWNFFDVIADSPRIEFACLQHKDEVPQVWQLFRPPPQRQSRGAILRRLVWNPVWNETLFIVSCAERLMRQPTAHSEDEIFRRIAADLRRSGDDLEGWLCLRLAFVGREGEALTREVRFQAAPRRMADIVVA